MATSRLTRPWLRRSAKVLLSCGLAFAPLGLAPWAQAAPPPAPANHWCPGDPWDPGWGSVYNWDWHQCHDWQGRPGQSGPAGWGPWGPPMGWAPPQPPPPPWAPGAQLMWNPTVNAWGFWNNGVWTPV